jgi:hypothetical protein
LFRVIKLVFIVVILWGFTTHLGHCSQDDDGFDKTTENKFLHKSSPASVIHALSPPAAEPAPTSATATLRTAFGCPDTYTHYSSIKSIVVSCSNGQILETPYFTTGQWLPFVKFGTKEKMGLKIKATDCPVTLTIRCLSTFLSFKVMREHLHSNFMAIPLEDYKIWRKDSVKEFTLERSDLFDRLGNPKYFYLHFFSSSPDLENVRYVMS